MVNLNKYFERIGWGGNVSPTFDTLAGIVAGHVRAIPFENLDVLLRRAIRLDPEGLQKKLVEDHRGGYCFEHATLMASVLEQIGFNPRRHSARVVLMTPRQQSPRTHMFLTVQVEGASYVVDPGFGPFAPSVPLPLDGGFGDLNGGWKLWVVRDGPYWTLKSKLGDKVVDGWVSTLEWDNPVDFDVANHFTATHPLSHFVNRLMMSAAQKGGRINVANRQVTISEGAASVTTLLPDRKALRDLLIEYFGFDLPEVEAMRVPAVPEWS